MFSMMSLEGQAKLFNQKATVAGKKYNRFFIYIPVELIKDSQFPFLENEKLTIKIDTEKKRLVIEKEKKTSSA